MPRRDARFLRARARGSVPPSDVTIIFRRYDPPPSPLRCRGPTAV